MFWKFLALFKGSYGNALADAKNGFELEEKYIHSFSKEFISKP